MVLLDVETMYPSIKFNMVYKAVHHYARKLNEDTKTTINRCLEMIKFGMENTLIQFKGKYYEYGGSEDVNLQGLTIGGHKSAFLADLVATYTLEEAEECFDETHYNGIYWDNGIALFKGIRTREELIEWLQKFQLKVSKIFNSKYL